MDYSTLKLIIKDYVAKIVFDQPQKANALDSTAWQELGHVFDALEKEDNVHVIILQGEGKHFCAGIDLKFLGSIQSQIEDACPGRTRENLRKLILSLQAPINNIENCSKPVIAAIQGACVGAGLDIIAACDMRFGTADAFFSIKEIDMAMVADLGSLQRLPKIMPEGIVREMAYTGKTLNAVEAKEVGLINQVYEDKLTMDNAVKSTAAIIAKKSALAIRGTKAVLNHARDNSVAQGLAYVATWNAAMLLSEDLLNILKASNEEKKQPLL